MPSPRASPGKVLRVSGPRNAPSHHARAIGGAAILACATMPPSRISCASSWRCRPASTRIASRGFPAALAVTVVPRQERRCSASLTLSDFVLRRTPSPPRSSANQRGPRTPDPHRVGAGWGWWTARRRASIRPTTPVMSAPRGLACAVTPPSVSRNMHRANSSEPCHESYFDFPSSPQFGFGPLLPPTGCWSKAARGCRATLALYPWVPSVYGAPFLLAITPFSPGIFTFAVLFWSLRVVSLVSYRPL